ncbi:hypothetical protein [Burkholderia ubonensis]|uniref:hypothetical protein n=1 Tax=Burkholderia ubonensis TaxID=101571 RepID=UPI000A5DFAE1|nr:hypothetical protein [Burkholderia ubonensis]
MAVTNSGNSPSYATVLEGLRHVCHRQVVRYRRGAPFDALAQMGFIVWVRQPIRLSQQVSERARLVPTPIEVAELTTLGRAALDWLIALEANAHWETLRSRPYGTHTHQGAP